MIKYHVPVYSGFQLDILNTPHRKKTTISVSLEICFTVWSKSICLSYCALHCRCYHGDRCLGVDQWCLLYRFSLFFFFPFFFEKRVVYRSLSDSPSISQTGKIFIMKRKKNETLMSKGGAELRLPPLDSFQMVCSLLFVCLCSRENLDLRFFFINSFTFLPLLLNGFIIDTTATVTG